MHAPGGVGRLPQAPDLRPDQTVAAAIDHALGELRAIERELRAVEEALATAADPDPLLMRYAALTEAFEAREGYGQAAGLALGRGSRRGWAAWTGWPIARFVDRFAGRRLALEHGRVGGDQEAAQIVRATDGRGT